MARANGRLVAGLVLGGVLLARLASAEEAVHEVRPEERGARHSRCPTGKGGT